jgi:hypothetical protein
MRPSQLGLMRVDPGEGAGSDPSPGVAAGEGVAGNGAAPTSPTKNFENKTLSLQLCWIRYSLPVRRISFYFYLDLVFHFFKYSYVEYRYRYCEIKYLASHVIIG